MRTGGSRSRGLIEESWARSEACGLVPDRIDVPIALADDELEHVRRTHPVADALPMIESLLVREIGEDTGLIVVVGDADGRLLWVDGDPRAMRRAETAQLVPGADWSESLAGTNAPGTALTLDRTLQVLDGEHFALGLRAMSCTAVPIRDLVTRETLGVLDVTGGPDAVGRGALPLVEATVAAVERELALHRLSRGGARAAREPGTAAPRLTVLGRSRALLTVAGRVVPISLRHAELLTLLAWHRDGLTASRLAELLHGTAAATAAVRPEMTRLRRLLEGAAPSLVPLTRPYRLPVPLELDARRLVQLLDRGAHRSAIDLYGGPLLPSSVAPGVVDIREEVAAHLREALLSAAAPELLLEYADAVVPADPEPLRTALRLLPHDAPARAAVVARLAALG